MTIYTLIIRRIFFLLEPEKAHYVAMVLFKYSCKIPFVSTLISYLYTPKHNDSFTFEGLNFKNKLGIGAGFDKNADFINELALLGFGHIEVGTVTPLPQPGNPRKRLFRLPKDKALINRMGFNNKGVEVMVQNLKKKQVTCIIGGNIGKNKNTPNDQAVNDYLICFEKLFDYVDYFTVNVSSPNTPELRALQDKAPLLNILLQLQKSNQSKVNPKPIFIKIAPDLSDELLADIIDVVIISKINGIVATNTTLSRINLKTSDDLTQEAGGLSGKPLFEKSLAIIQKIYTINKNIKIIGVGGVSTADDYNQLINAGVSLVQIYTSFIYLGPNTAQIITNKN